ncbi:GNAT family N-acetyltransferase [Brachybacterium paraconglomeratum]|uniref:GNAT family N-acetyltransferase n=1 Tax=Brachybacterium paraconglomeratum TaxID=173362 RepID=UPI00223B81A5|nr:GNAT family N-acetyltransferase [Brachybacterium paraconglomeratum]MCT1436554.1 GNAT family N-acetyltransferase [Brachybacterium paraconglomeratum]
MPLDEQPHVGSADAPSGTEHPVLDNPAWSSLTGAHRELAIGNEHVLRYPEDVSPFVGVRDWEHPDVWDAILDVFGHDAVVSVSHADPLLPAGWAPEFQIPGVQLVQTDRLAPRPEPEAVELGAADTDEMLALIAQTRPGPFEARTHEMGRYIGIRRDGQLIAMAGERLHPDGWTEISAVAVHPEHRRQGLASRLVLDVAHHIQRRGDRALLHASAANTAAIAGYEKLGFELRRRLTFGALRTP